MMMVALIAALLSSGPTINGAGCSNCLLTKDYRTPGTGGQTYFVDATLGSDSNSCTASGSSACLTIQGGLNKAPKLLRDLTTISIAAGNYAGFTVSGFTTDNGVQQTTGGLLISGALATSTLATGSATGTAAGAGQLAGSGSTFGVLCDSGATWTSNDLRGRFVTTTLPTNTALVISSNTSTCLTVVGTWSLPVAAQTTYTVQDPSVIVTSGVSQAATPLNAASANRAGAELTGNNIRYRTNALVINNMRFAPTAGSGFEVSDSSLYRLENVQVRPSAATASGIFYNASPAGSGQIVVSKCDVSLASTGALVSTGGGLFSSTGSLYRNSGAALNGLSIGISFGSAAQLVFTSSEIQGAGQSGGVALGLFSGVAQGGGGGFSGNRIACFAANATGIFLGSGLALTTFMGSATSLTSITTTDISTCNTALAVVAPAAADVTSMSGAAATTGFLATLGGVIAFDKAGTTITAGTNEVNLDSGGVTANFADVTAGSCITSVPQASKVCGR